MSKRPSREILALSSKINMVLLREGAPPLTAMSALGLSMCAAISAVCPTKEQALALAKGHGVIVTQYVETHYDDIKSTVAQMAKEMMEHPQ